MAAKGNREVLEDLAIFGGLIGVQFLYAGNSVLLSYVMSIGFTPSSLIILSTFATFLLLSPVSIILERSLWPKKFHLKLWIQLLLISFGGITLFQSLFLRGIQMTSPAMATAMPNLAPGLIFFIAWAFRFEKVELRCKYSRAKIAGTFLCVAGAFIMNLLQTSKGPVTTPEAQEFLLSPPEAGIFDKQITGSLYLMAAVFVLSSTVVLQATTLGDFPAPISLSAITSLLGAIMTGIVQLIEEHNLTISLPMLCIRDLICYSLLVGSNGGICVSFNAWAMKKRGPVLVAMFNPVGTVISVILSVITLGDSIALGSFAGMCLMFTGLYFVLWAKGKEASSPFSDNYVESEYDVEKALLS